MTSLEEYAQQINQEIKDKKLGYKDPEYYRLKMKISTRNIWPSVSAQNVEKLVHQRHKFYHKRKGKHEDKIWVPQSNDEALKDESDLKVKESIEIKV